MSANTCIDCIHIHKHIHTYLSKSLNEASKAIRLLSELRIYIHIGGKGYADPLVGHAWPVIQTFIQTRWICVD